MKGFFCTVILIAALLCSIHYGFLFIAHLITKEFLVI
jgi:hypothetical protein